MGGKPENSITRLFPAHPPIPCDPEFAMKFVFAILALVLVVVSFFTDYKWRKWIADRRRERQ
jgi:hypothetical protein